MRGGCHCGNIRVELTTNVAPADLRVFCQRCGVYVAALIDDARATLNANTLECALEIPQGDLIDYSDETAAQRRARRLQAWTPVVVH